MRAPSPVQPREPLDGLAQIALLAVALLGLLALCLVLAQGGFTHSDKRGGHAVFVAAPLADLAALPFLALSVLAVVAVLRARRVAAPGYLAAAVAYAALGWVGYRLVAQLAP